MATWSVFVKLFGIAITFGFGEKRCRKNLPLADAPHRTFSCQSTHYQVCHAAMSEKLKVESEKEDSRYVPVHIARPLLEECGYRCSVPRCKGTSALQLEHIEDWAKLDFKKHSFDKMIVLCATCHARVTSKEIHKDAIRAYKRNLAVINGRYSLFEMRLLGQFFSDRDNLITYESSFRNEKYNPSEVIPFANGSSVFFATEGEKIHLAGLLRDALVSAHRLNTTATFSQETLPDVFGGLQANDCLLYTSPSPRDQRGSRMPSSA